MMRRGIVIPSAWRDGVMPCMKDHGPHPGPDSENAVDHGAFDKRLEWRAQNLKKISEKHPRDVVGDDKHHPSDHRRREHLNRALQEAHNWNEHEDHEETVGGCVSFERPAVEPGKSVRGHQRTEHYHHEQRAGVESGPKRGTRKRLVSFCSDNSIDWGTIGHGFAGWPSIGTLPEAGALAWLSLPARSTAVAVYT